jgi:hypothetical protein
MASEATIAKTAAPTLASRASKRCSIVRRMEKCLGVGQQAFVLGSLGHKYCFWFNSRLRRNT